MRILVADDDAVSRRLLQSYLEKWGHQVVTAVNGLEAWKAFQQEEFPVVISDWMMPEMDGPELVRHIRAATRAAYVFIILVTARSQKEDVVEGMEAGADDFVTKPFDRDELRVRLRAGERILGLEMKLAAQMEALAGARSALEASQQRAEAERNAAHRAKQQLQSMEQQLESLLGSWPDASTPQAMRACREQLDRLRRALQSE